MIVKTHNSSANNDLTKLFNFALQFQGYQVELNQTYLAIKKIGVEKCFSYFYDITSLPSTCAQINLKELQSFYYLQYNIIYFIVLKSMIYKIQFQKNIEKFKEIAKKEYLIWNKVYFNHYKNKVIKNIKMIPLKKNKWVFNYIGKNQFYLIFSFLTYEQLIKMRQVSRSLKVVIDNYINQLISILKVQRQSMLNQVNIREDILPELMDYFSFDTFMNVLPNRKFYINNLSNAQHCQFKKILQVVSFMRTQYQHLQIDSKINYQLNEVQLQSINSFLDIFTIEDIKLNQCTCQWFLYLFLQFLISFNKKNLNQRKFKAYYNEFTSHQELIQISHTILLLEKTMNLANDQFLFLLFKDFQQIKRNYFKQQNHLMRFYSNKASQFGQQEDIII
ncbi:hypothetical protein ABPG73_009034 [Tetrahymena malaccensis]